MSMCSLKKRPASRNVRYTNHTATGLFLLPREKWVIPTQLFCNSVSESVFTGDF